MGYMFICYSAAGVAVCFVSMFVNHYRFYFWIYIALMGLFSLSFFYFEETPFYYHNSKQVRKLYGCLVGIARRNKPAHELEQVKATLAQMLQLETPPLSLDQPEEQQAIKGGRPSPETEKKPHSLHLSLVKNPKPKKAPRPPHKKNRLGFLALFDKDNLMPFVYFINILVYLEIIWAFSILINKDLGLENVFVNGILLHLFQVLGLVVALVFFQNSKRRAVNIGAIWTSLVSAAVLLTVDLLSNLKVHYDQRHSLVRAAETGSHDQGWDS